MINFDIEEMEQSSEKAEIDYKKNVDQRNQGVSMNFTDIQVELREIEARIEQLHSEIEKMKPQAEEEQKENYAAITRLAYQHPVKNETFLKTTEHVKKMTIGSLSYFFVADKQDIYDRMLYLCRLSKGIGLEWSAEDIYKEGLGFDEWDMGNLCRDLWDDKYAYLTEAFMIAGLSEDVRNFMPVVADLAQMFDCDKEEIRVIAQVAKSVLEDNTDILNEIQVTVPERWCGQFRDYIPYKWIIDQRIKCDEICTVRWMGKYEYDEEDETCNTNKKALGFMDQISKALQEEEKRQPAIVRMQLENGSLVKKGESVLECDEQTVVKESIGGGGAFRIRIKEQEKKILAPCDGIVYYVDFEKKSRIEGKMDHYMAIYVVSYFDDYDSFLYAVQG